MLALIARIRNSGKKTVISVIVNNDYFDVIYAKHSFITLMTRLFPIHSILLSY